MTSGLTSLIITIGILILIESYMSLVPGSIQKSYWDSLGKQIHHASDIFVFLDIQNKGAQHLLKEFEENNVK